MLCIASAKLAYACIKTNPSLILLLRYWVCQYGDILLEADRPREVYNNESAFPGYCRTYIEKEPKIEAMGIDIVL